MQKNLVKDENHITIQGWMVNRLKLSGNELIIYALIYGFSQTEEHTFHGSLSYICNWTNISKNSCISNIQKLLSKNLIIKTEKEMNGLKFCEYRVNLNSIQETCISIQETLTNNIDNNIDKTILDKSNIDIAENEDLEESVIIPKKNNQFVLKENAKCIIQYLNESIGSKYRFDSKETLKLIKQRFDDGYVLDDFYDVIDKKVKEWINTDMQKYLRPSTLFGNKFENYVNQKNYFKGTVKSSYGSKPSFDNTANHQDSNSKISDKEFNEMSFEDKKFYIAGMAVTDMTDEQRGFFNEYCIAKDENGNDIEF